MKRILIICGFPKCGSTALASYLGQHKEINYSLKETYSFLEGIRLYNEQIRTPVFSSPPSKKLTIKTKRSENKYWLEGSVGYFWKITGRNLKDMAGSKAKILFCIRNPVERLKSTYFFAVYWKASLEEWLTNEPSLYLYFSYYPFIKDYTETFGRENVRVVLSEQLRERPQQVCDQIFEWLGLEKVGIKRIEANRSYIAHPQLIQKIKKFTSVISNMAIKSPFKHHYIKSVEILSKHNCMPLQIIGRIFPVQKKIKIREEIKEVLFKDYMRTIEYCHKREILVLS